jgi:hypothetical protein
VNSAGISMSRQLSVLYANFLPFRNITKSGISGSYRSSSLEFWETYILFSMVVILMYINTNIIHILFLPHPCQNLLFLFLFWGGFLLLSFGRFFILWTSVLCQMNGWQNFSPILWTIFALVIISYFCAEFFNLMWSQMSTFAFISWSIWVLSGNCCLCQYFILL